MEYKIFLRHYMVKLALANVATVEVHNLQSRAFASYLLNKEIFILAQSNPYITLFSREIMKIINPPILFISAKLSYCSRPKMKDPF